MNGIRIVDSHHHLWRREDIGRDGILGEPYLDQDFSWEDFNVAWDGLDVGATVFVQVRDDEDEVEYVQSVAERNRGLAAMIAWAPLEDPEVYPVLARLRRRPLVRGVRRNTQHEPDPDFVSGDGYVRGARLLGEMGLVCEVCVRREQIAAVPRLARACPETAIVVEHLGKPDVSGPPPAAWLHSVEELGRLPNVYCKVSTVVHSVADQSPRSAVLAPYLTHLVATLGWERLLFGSNWPVSTALVSYRGWVELLDGLLDAATPEQRAAFFAGNAARLYALD